MMGDGKLKCVVDPTPFKGLEQVSDAIDHMYTGKNQGKVGGFPGFSFVSMMRMAISIHFEKHVHVTGAGHII